MSLLSLINLSKYYTFAGQRQNILKDLQLCLSEPQVVSIMGPSGSGKSTLLKIIGLLEIPDQGCVEIAGISCNELSDKRRTAMRREKLGLIFQSFNLLPDFTVTENVNMPQLMCGVTEKKATYETKKLLIAFGIEHKANNLPNHLSGGEQQRVAIARSLVNNPVLLLADEPTGNLDSQNSANIIKILCKISEEKKIPVIIVTHDLSIAKQTDKIFLLQNGALKIKNNASRNN